MFTPIWRLFVAAIAVVALAATMTSVAMASSLHELKREYSHAWWLVRLHTPDSPGRNIRASGLSSGRKASRDDYVRSLQELNDIIRVDTAPPPVIPASYQAPVEPSTTSVSTATPATTVQTAVTSSVSAAPSSGLMSCIIKHESGGNPQATNGQYGGIGQWNANSWAQYGGTQYASSPTGATYAQQVQVLQNEGTAGMQQQQAQYDGC